MIPFQTQTFLKVLTHRAHQETRRRAIGRRALLATVFPAIEAANAAALALDEARHPFRDIPIEAPIFVVGPPRCGTTRLHRLLARDERFTTFRLWQIMAPSITAQTLTRRIAAMDAHFGGPLRKRLDDAQANAFQSLDGLHHTRLTEPEEDEALFLHAFGTELLANAFPLPDVLMEYRSFDTLPAARRDALMHYYRGCVQRHLLMEGRDRRFLSKNPVFCGKLPTLREAFPDARFVLPVRHPVEALSSFASLMVWLRTRSGVPAPDAVERERLLQFTADCFRSTLDAADGFPAGTVCLVRYEDLVSSPRAVIDRIYGTFGISVTPRYADALVEEEAAAKAYRSRHHHHAEGYDPARIDEVLGFVYERLGYAR